MCLLCGDTGRHSIALTERPAHRLTGLSWEGSHAEASAGAVQFVLAEVKALSDASVSSWKSPIVGISWNDRPDGFRYFAGVVLDDGEAVPAGFSRIEFPLMHFVSSWHAAGDGDVVDHYARIIEWAWTEGLDRDIASFHHREEYPPDVDFALPPALRLLLPVSAGTLR